MTAGKKTVHIRIESSGGGQSSKQQTEGELYETASGSIYVRYPDPDPSLGRTTTTVKWKENEIRVLRHGDVESDQTFVKGSRMSGSYRLAAERAGTNAQARDRILLECVARTMRNKQIEGGYSVKWSYEMYVDGQFTGVYKLKLDIKVID